jgi:hypothetical protein
MTVKTIKYGDTGGTEVYLECDTSRVTFSKVVSLAKRTTHDHKRDPNPKPRSGTRITIPGVFSTAITINDENWLTYPSDMSNAVWLKGCGSVVHAAAISPINTLTADIYQESGTGEHQIVQYHGATAPNHEHRGVCSIYAKKGIRKILLMVYQNKNAVQFWAAFDVNAGTYLYGNGGWVEDGGNGWYRCCLPIWNGIGSGTPYILLYICNDGHASNYASPAGNPDSMYFWGSKVEPYPATNKNLLQKTQDTVINSDMYLGAVGATISADSACSPPEGTTALKVVCPGTRLYEGCGILGLWQMLFGLTPGKTYLLSYKLKASAGLANNLVIGFNSYTEATSGWPSYSNGDSYVIDASTEWRRHMISLCPTGDTLLFQLFTYTLEARTFYIDEIMIEDAVTSSKNLLNHNVATGCGFGSNQRFEKVQGTETFSADDTEQYKGVFCLKCDTSGSTPYEGFMAGWVAVTGTGNHTFSLYLKGSIPLYLQLIEFTNGYAYVGETTEIITLTSEWQRFQVTRSISNADGKIYGRILTQSAVSTAVYADCLQMEKADSATAWESPIADPSEWEAVGGPTPIGGSVTVTEAGQAAITNLKTLIGTGHTLTIFGEPFTKMYVEKLTPVQDKNGMTKFDITFIQDTTGGT